MEHIQKFVNSLGLAFRKELLGILIITLLFFLFPILVRKIDSTAAAIDPGILSGIILAISAVLIFKALTWWIIKSIWPVFAKYSELHFERNFRGLNSLQKVVIYLGFYLMIFYAFIIVLGALI